MESPIQVTWRRASDRSVLKTHWEKGKGKSREERGRGALLQKHLSREGATVMETRPTADWCSVDPGQTEDFSLHGAVGASAPMPTSPVSSARDIYA